jgi:hypothetical protein
MTGLSLARQITYAMNMIMLAHIAMWNTIDPFVFSGLLYVFGYFSHI